MTRNLQQHVNNLIGRITRLENAFMETKNLEVRNKIEKDIRILKVALGYYKLGLKHEQKTQESDKK